MSDLLYDLSYIEKLSLGNQEFIQQLVDLFVETVPEHIEKIEKALSNSDLVEMGREAHKLKSTISSIQVPSVIDRVKEIEAIGKSGVHHPQLDELVKEVKQILLKTVDQIKQRQNNE